MTDFDLIVVGGGPGGSTLASFVAMRGWRVLLLEREEFPRYHIGESLMVSTIQGLCRSLGVWTEVNHAGFVRKPGAAFRWGDSPELWSLSFTQARQLDAKSINYAFHVERSQFDQILVDNARKKGVRIEHGVQVEDLALNGDRICGIQYRSTSGTVCKITAKFVADASGHSSRLYSRFGGRVYSQFFRNVAVFCYFENAARLPHPLEGAGINEAFADGWMWFLPLTTSLTSVGAVIGSEQAALLHHNREDLILQFIAACPYVARLLKAGTRILSGPYGDIRVKKDFSYTNERFWRPGGVLVGDSACFVDPLFTTGVHFATYAALLAARSINSVLSGDLDETVAFTEFEFRYRLEYELFYNFVVAYYDMNNCPNENGFWYSRKVDHTPEASNVAFIQLLTNGLDEPRSYFEAKHGVGIALQQLVNQLMRANTPTEHAAFSRHIAEYIHSSFLPPSGRRPFHLGFEDIRQMTWGNNDWHQNNESSIRPLRPSACGLLWQHA